MKPCIFYMVVITTTLFLSSCNQSRPILYMMENQTGTTITIYPPYSPYGDSTILNSGDYFTIGHFSTPKDGPVIESFYMTYPVYISMEGVKYQIDRNQDDNCLWERNYHPAPEALADSLRQFKNELVRIYVLTEAYIKRQIVVDE